MALRGRHGESRWDVGRLRSLLSFGECESNIFPAGRADLWDDRSVFRASLVKVSAFDTAFGGNAIRGCFIYEDDFETRV